MMSRYLLRFFDHPCVSLRLVPALVLVGLSLGLAGCGGQQAQDGSETSKSGGTT